MRWRQHKDIPRPLALPFLPQDAHIALIATTASQISYQVDSSTLLLFIVKVLLQVLSSTWYQLQHLIETQVCYMMMTYQSRMNRVDPNGDLLIPLAQRTRFLSQQAWKRQYRYKMLGCFHSDSWCISLLGYRRKQINLIHLHCLNSSRCLALDVASDVGCQGWKVNIKDYI